MDPKSAFKRAALYHTCRQSKILSNVNFEQSDTESLVELVNQHNAHTIRELPILVAKITTKGALSFLVSKFPHLRSYVEPENIRVAVESDELAYLVNSPSKPHTSIVPIVLKNLALNAVGSSIARFKDDILSSVNTVVTPSSSSAPTETERIVLSQAETPANGIAVSAPQASRISDFGVKPPSLLDECPNASLRLDTPTLAHDREPVEVAKKPSDDDGDDSKANVADAAADADDDDASDASDDENAHEMEAEEDEGDVESPDMSGDEVFASEREPVASERNVVLPSVIVASAPSTDATPSSVETDDDATTTTRPEKRKSSFSMFSGEIKRSRLEIEGADIEEDFMRLIGAQFETARGPETKRKRRDTTTTTTTAATTQRQPQASSFLDGVTFDDDDYDVFASPKLNGDSLSRSQTYPAITM